MKRRELFLKIWRKAYGCINPGTHIAILGGGLSGMHLACSFAKKGFRVTVCEKENTGGIRIPLMHACETPKARGILWETAARFSRDWYAAVAEETGAVLGEKGAQGIFFTVGTRAYLRHLKRKLQALSVAFLTHRVEADLTCVATGDAARAMLPGWANAAMRTIPGLESYFSRIPEGFPGLLRLPPRAAQIHLNNMTAEAASAEAEATCRGARRALFRANRLATRDRLPFVGFLPPDGINTYGQLYEAYRNQNAVLSHGQPSAFFFCAMGYHAMTYGPYLADRVAAQFAGEDTADENLISTLTPARFLPPD